jgi:hypothetical protein
LEFYTKYVPDSIKKGLLTAVPNKDKNLSNPSNYRGITVISIICKLLEMCIRAGIEGWYIVLPYIIPLLIARLIQ